VGFNSFHAGRGFDKFVPNQYGFYNSRSAWTTTPGKVHATQLFRWAKGLRNADFNMPDASGVTWKRLTGTQRYLDVSFVASATYTAARLVLLIRRRVPAGSVGVPGTFTAEVCADSAAYPGTVATTSTVTSATITDVVSEYYVWGISTALVSGTTYHVKVYGASTDRDEACWEIAVDPTASGLSNSVNTNWSSTSQATTFSPYYRVTDADTARTFKPFIWDRALYLVDIKDNGTTASQLYINGVRGKATSGSTTTIVDTGNGTYGGTAWPTNRFTNAYVHCIRGTGQGQTAIITSNNGTTLNFAAQTIAFDSTSEYLVYSTDWFVEISTTGLGVVTGQPCIQNGIVYFPQGDSVNIRIMHMDYTDADDHAFDVENSNNNKAYFLTDGYDAAAGPQMWRANEAVTTGTPAAKKISVARAPTTPSGTPVPFGTDVLFGASIPTGDNTNLITNIIFSDENLYVPKEDSLFVINADRASQIKIGADTAPDIYNGICAVIGADKQIYMGWEKDVYQITGGGAYPLGMQSNLPSTYSGYAADIEAKKGWIFAAVDAGTGTSSVMKYSLDTKSWSQQFQSYFAGRRIRSVQWQDCPGTRPRLWTEVSGSLVVQEFPLNSVRPYDDSGQKYQHEFVIEFPTVDLLTTDPKYFSRLTVTSQGLAQPDDTESGHEIMVEYQADNNVGSSTWAQAGKITTSPSGYVDIGQGGKRMLRIRLRGISTEASDPVIIETIGLSLFSRHKLSHQWQMFFDLSSDDDEQTSLDVIRWLRDAAQTSQPLMLLSTYPLYHERLVTLPDEPQARIQEFDQEAGDIEGNIGLILDEVV
jgi:hypothetical protein